MTKDTLAAANKNVRFTRNEKKANAIMTLADMMKSHDWARSQVERLYDLGIDDCKQQLAILRIIRAARVFFNDNTATVDSFEYFGENYTAAEFLQSSHYNKQNYTLPHYNK